MTCGPRACSFDTPAATDGPATASSFILVTPDGERTMNTYLGACVNFTTADVDAKVVEAAQVTYMEGYLWDRPEAKEAFKLAASIARAAGRKTSITLSDSFCVERHRDSFLDLIRNDIDIVFANESEIKSLYLTQNFDGALQAIAKDCPIAVLTRSAAGCVVVSSKSFTRHRPIRSTRWWMSLALAIYSPRVFCLVTPGQVAARNVRNSARLLPPK